MRLATLYHCNLSLEAISIDIPYNQKIRYFNHLLHECNLYIRYLFIQLG